MTIYEFVYTQISKTPDATAIIFGNKKLTYGQLGNAVKDFSSHLHEYGIAQSDIVGISLDRSPEMIIAMLAISKLGATYLPLDPAFPVNRLEYMLNDSGARFLVTEKKLERIFTGFAGKILCREDINANYSEDPGTFGNEDSRAYLLYTSGSTGKPKGVQISQGSLINFLLSMKETPGFNSRDRLLAITTISFDISGLEIYLPLITGGIVDIVSKEESIDGKILLEKLKESTVFQATPATFKLLIESGWNEKLHLKALCGGESLSVDLASKILERVDELWNMYGPTETTIWSSCAKVENGKSIHLGKPIKNTQFYVKDENNNFCAPGVPGELLIGGDGLSSGYLNNDELTLQKFIKNPFDKTGNSKVYRTGDLVKINNEYQLEFLGRMDNQVKIRGFRIELGEIENSLNDIEFIKDAAVVSKEFDQDDHRLAAFIIVNNVSLNDQLPDSSDLTKKIKNKLSSILPDYMIPAYFVYVEEFPLTPNGKIDRKKLSQSAISVLAERNKESVAPRNKNDEILVDIWKKILNIESISIDDNFFEIGGHSILAAQVFTEFENKTGIKIPLATLFKFQTVREIVDSINTDFYKTGWTPLVEIRKGNTKKNLFLVHGAEGNVLLYRELSKHLDPDYSIFGFQARGLNGNGYISASIEEMATDYLDAIVTVQPEGPYNLGGYCMGGTIAYELAQQLTKTGNEVSNLFLIETYNACMIDKSMHTDERFENIKFHLDNLKKIEPGKKIKFINQKAQVTKRRLIARLNSVYDKLGIELNEAEGASKLTFKVRDTNDKAQADYIPEKYTGKTVLLRPVLSYSSEPDPDFGWRHLASGKFIVYNRDLAPRGMLVEPFVKETAAIITKELRA